MRESLANPNTFLAPAKRADSNAQQGQEVQQDSIIGYTSGGDPSVPVPEIDIDSDNCYAKKVEKNGTIHYFVKVGRDGYIFDPWGTFSEGTQSKQLVSQGRKAWEWQKVSKKVFEYYLKFLQSRNRAWKNNAEREIRNG